MISLPTTGEEFWSFMLRCYHLYLRT
jgi:hypothetical protein